MEQIRSKGDIPDTFKSEDLGEPPKKRFSDDTQSNSEPGNVHQEGKHVENYVRIFPSLYRSNNL